MSCHLLTFHVAQAMVHIHTACEECEVIKLLYEVDPKTKEQKKAKFVKQGQVCICRIQVAQVSHP